MTKTKGGCIAVCLSLLFSACGVTIERYESLQKQHNQCTTDLNQASTSLLTCQADLNKASASSAELSAKNKTYEDLVGSLKGEISAGKVKISQIQDRLSVNLIDKILFDVGSYTLGKEGKTVLKKIAEVIKAVKDKRIQVEGHTDDARVSGGRSYTNNWDLSVLRATSVVKVFVQEGVPGSKISAAGFAEFMPVASNKLEEGRRQNRRIEIILLPEMKAKDISKLNQ